MRCKFCLVSASFHNFYAKQEGLIIIIIVIINGIVGSDVSGVGVGVGGMSVGLRG